MFKLSVLSENIRFYRKVVLNLTQSAFAARYELNRGNIDSYERIETNPGQRFYLKLITLDNLNVSLFMTRKMTPYNMENFFGGSAGSVAAEESKNWKYGDSDLISLLKGLEAKVEDQESKSILRRSAAEIKRLTKENSSLKIFLERMSSNKSR